MWEASNEYPDISGCQSFSIDLETYDPKLLLHGPGALRKDGFVVGFSIATPEGFSGYYPLRHSEGNVKDPEKAISWLKSIMALDKPKIGANILYDMIWMYFDLGISCRGPKYDVQIAEPLIDENRRSYSLDSLSEHYLGLHKEEELLKQAAVEVLGLKPGAKDLVKAAKGAMHKIPARYIGPYGTTDAVLPIKILEKQLAILSDGLMDVWKIETRLVDMLFDMWIKGVPVDTVQGEIARDEMKNRYNQIMKDIQSVSGMAIDIWSADSLAKLCDNYAIPFLRTDNKKRCDEGNPSFKSAWLANHPHFILNKVAEARVLDRSGSVFIQDKILNLAVNGRIHPQFWQVKKDDGGGTGSGRFSSSNPNAQQFPAPKPGREEVSKLVRDILIAEPGCRWTNHDYSQQEPRVTIHYAAVSGLPGADVAVKQFCDNPATDYHQMVADWAEITRKNAKSLNLGLAYGMGKKKLASELGLPYNEACTLFDKYHSALPYINSLNEYVKKVANHRGFIRTIMGRRRHFDRFGPRQWSEGIVPKVYDEAVKEFGKGVVRYWLHKVLNGLIQGTSADMLKLAMLNCYEAGYVPSLTVHDELCFSDIQEDRQIREISEIMTNAVKLRVPLLVKTTVGTKWGSCEKFAG